MVIKEQEGGKHTVPPTPCWQSFPGDAASGCNGPSPCPGATFWAGAWECTGVERGLICIPPAFWPRV
jgi:hypothetical protein